MSKVRIVLEARTPPYTLGETESLSRQERLALETFPVYNSNSPELEEC